MSTLEEGEFVEEDQQAKQGINSCHILLLLTYKEENEENTKPDEVWDDSALIDAYNNCVQDYMVSSLTVFNKYFLPYCIATKNIVTNNFF